MLGEEDCEERDYYQQGGADTAIEMFFAPQATAKIFLVPNSVCPSMYSFIEESKLNTKKNFSRECTTYELVPT